MSVAFTPGITEAMPTLIGPMSDFVTLLADKPLNVIDDDTVIMSSVVGLNVGSGLGTAVGSGEGP